MNNFQGLVKFENLAVNMKMIISAFPAGTYIGVMTYSNNDDQNIITVKYVQEIISKDRKEF